MAHVLDQAELLSPAVEARIQARLAATEAASDARVLVVTLPSLDGRSIDAVSEEIGTRLGLDDGVLMVLALQDRELRISVGQGAMRKVTNADAERIVTAMQGELGKDRFEAGILIGVDRIAAELSESIA